MTTQSLDAIMGGREDTTPAEVNNEPKPVAETPEPKAQPRDEKGKFSAKEGADRTLEPAAKPKEESQPAAALPAGTGDAAKPAATQPPAGYIPIQAHDAEKGKRRRLEDEVKTLRAELAKLQGQPQAQSGKPAQAQGDPLVDFLSDPEAYFERKFEGVTKRLSATEEKISERFAVKEYGLETVEAAKAAALDLSEDEANVAQYALLITRLKQSDHPFDELVKWHQEQQRNAKYGDEASIEAEIERRVAEKLAAQPQPAPKPNLSNAPSSFANAPSGGPRSAPGAGGPRALSEIMGGR